MENLPGDIYLVGGAVRDQRLGLTINERDWVVVGSTPDALLELGFRQVGKEFPVFLHPTTKEEYALARTERKMGPGHRGFEAFASPDVTLEDDLARRDLTINAIAIDASGVVYDPYQGCDDLEKRILRHVTDAFSEDPLRVLRVARFAARFNHLGFRIADETLTLMQNISDSGELGTLSSERIWRETEKALRTDSPRVFFELLRECRALVHIYPEVDALFGVEQRVLYHPEIDAGLHTMLALDQICMQSSEPTMRFATLVHDLGKATTPQELLPSHRGHEARSAELTDKLCDRIKVPNEFRNLAVRVARHHLNCHRALELKPATIEKMLSSLDTWRREDYLVGFVNCCMADARGRTGLESRPYPQFDFLLECADAAKKIDIGALQKTGLTGEKLGEGIRSARIQAIAGVKERYHDVDESIYAKAPSKAI